MLEGEISLLDGALARAGQPAPEQTLGQRMDNIQRNLLRMPWMVTWMFTPCTVDADAFGRQIYQSGKDAVNTAVAVGSAGFQAYLRFISDPLGQIAADREMLSTVALGRLGDAVAKGGEALVHAVADPHVQMLHLLTLPPESVSDTTLATTIGGVMLAGNPVKVTTVEAGEAAVADFRRRVIDAIVEGRRAGSALEKTDAMHAITHRLTRDTLERGEIVQYKNGDGTIQTLLQVPGTYSADATVYRGVFEYQLRPDGVIVHNRFVPNVGISGRPNNVPGKGPPLVVPSYSPPGGP